MFSHMQSIYFTNAYKRIQTKREMYFWQRKSFESPTSHRTNRVGRVATNVAVDGLMHLPVAVLHVPRNVHTQPVNMDFTSGVVKMKLTRNTRRDTRYTFGR